MLRESLVESLYGYMTTGSYFVPGDFVVHNADDSEDADTDLLIVTYRFLPKYYSRSTFRKLSDGKLRIHVAESPGQIRHEDVAIYADLDEWRIGFVDWIGRLRVELSALPLARQVAEQEKELADLAKRYEGLGGVYFSHDEAAVFRGQLEDLERRMVENLKLHADAEEKIARLHQDVLVLKGQLEALDKRGWFGSFIVRMARWKQDPANQALLSAGTKLATDLLLEAGEQIGDIT